MGLGLWDYTSYSFQDLSGVMRHPGLKKSFVFTEGGVGQIVVLMSNETTFHDYSVKGVVIVGRTPINSGKMQIQCQQTSNVHKWLLYLYNYLMNWDPNEVVNAGDWAKMTVSLRSITDHTGHELRGVSFDKVPDKTYAAQGGMVTWSLSAASIKSTAPNVSDSGNAVIEKLKGLLE